MVSVKVCGLTSINDVVVALDAGANALGFVFAPTSPRYMGENTQLIDFLGQLSIVQPFVAVFGICPGFHHPAFQLVQATEFLGETIMQRFLTVRQTPEFDLAEIRQTAESLSVAALVVDAFHPTKEGGTGTTVDFDFAKMIVDETPFPVILAGGLNPENVAEAVRYVRPYGVDASSGLESSPGIKDPLLVARFIQAAKNA